MLAIEGMLNVHTYSTIQTSLSACFPVPPVLGCLPSAPLASSQV